MITKAIVEEVLSPYQVRVRVPTLDRVTTSQISTSNENLNVATICSLPNCYTNIQVGDVVIVGFEDNTYYTAVILGHLCRSSESSTYANLKLNDLLVNTKATLPRETTIGDVSSQEVSCLSGINDNIQRQLDSLKEQIQVLQDIITNS